jgi:mannose-6-phosphate isomerase-like protein (cupin superfamily)
MAFFIDERVAPVTALHGGRGVSLRLINETTGSQHVDFHVNILKAQSGPGPYHYHSNAENIYYVIEGRAKVTIEGKATLAGPGEAVFIPAGERHDVENVGEGDLKVIEVKAPWNSDFINAESAQ